MSNFLLKLNAKFETKDMMQFSRPYTLLFSVKDENNFIDEVQSLIDTIKKEEYTNLETNEKKCFDVVNIESIQRI
jgi:hypothetical protein